MKLGQTPFTSHRELGRDPFLQYLCRWQSVCSWFHCARSTKARETHLLGSTGRKTGSLLAQKSELCFLMEPRRAFSTTEEGTTARSCGMHLPWVAPVPRHFCAGGEQAPQGSGGARSVSVQLPNSLALWSLKLHPLAQWEQQRVALVLGERTPSPTCCLQPGTACSPGTRGAACHRCPDVLVGNRLRGATEKQNRGRRRPLESPRILLLVLG